MPLGSSKFFRGKQVGNTSQFDGYPTWPAMPDLDTFTKILEGYTSTGGVSNIHLSHETALPSQSTSTSTLAEDLRAMPAFNGNVYITSKGGYDSSGPLWVYDDTSGNIAEVTPTPDISNDGPSGIAQVLPVGSTGAHVSVRRVSPYKTAQVDLVNGTSTVSAANYAFNDPGNLLLSDTVLINTGYSTSMIAMGRGSGATDAMAYTFSAGGGGYGNHSYIPYSPTYGGGGPTIAAAVSPDTGRIYISGNPGQRFDFINDLGHDFIPSGGEAAFANASGTGGYFGTAQLGVDKNIYFLPYVTGHAMVYNPTANTATTIYENEAVDNVTEVLGNVVAGQDVYKFQGHTTQRKSDDNDNHITFNGITDANLTFLNGKSFRTTWQSNVSGYVLNYTNNAQAVESLVNSNITLTDGTGSWNTGNSYIDSTLGVDGNIYAYSFSGNGASNVQTLMSIDTKPDSATYKQTTYYDIPGLTDSSYISFCRIGQSGNGTLLGIGRNVNMPYSNQVVAKCTISGSGLSESRLNPVLNNGN